MLPKALGSQVWKIRIQTSHLFNRPKGLRSPHLLRIRSLTLECLLHQTLVIPGTNLYHFLPMFLHQDIKLAHNTRIRLLRLVVIHSILLWAIMANLLKPLSRHIQVINVKGLRISSWA